MTARERGRRAIVRFARVLLEAHQVHGLLRAATAIVSLRCRHPFRGRERCDNRLSYSNIGDEQVTIYVAAFAGADGSPLAVLPR